MSASQHSPEDLAVKPVSLAMLSSTDNDSKAVDGRQPLFEDMRLRKLEVLERVAASGKLNVVLGEKGLVKRVVNLL